MVSALRINELVLHGIVKSGPDVVPQLSQAAPALDERTKTFLQEQVRDALKYGRQIIEDSGASPVPDHIRSYWGKTTALLECSQQLATLLQSNQPAQSPVGLLLVAEAHLGSDRAFIVAKLEHERGAQATEGRDDQGRFVFDMEYLDRLIFTQGSKVYKIGCFLPGDDPVSDTLRGLVVDRQAPAHHVAKYFREGFLGCTWRERPEVVTEQFFDAAQAWIDTVSSPERRSRYQLALISDMQSPSSDLSVPRFAQTYLEREDRDDFTATMRDKVSTLNLPKSIEYVRTRLANIRYDMETGVVVMAPPERVDDGTVTVEPDEDGKSIVRVRDRIKKTSGYGAYHP